MSDRSANLLGALSLLVVERIETGAKEQMIHGGQSAAALVVLGYGDRISIDRLRRILGLSHPGTVRLVDRLEKDGLVERAPGDTGREVVVRLTRTGRETREGLLRSRLATIGSLLGPLSPEEDEALGALLARVLDALGASESERYHICRLCDDRVCSDCPLPTRKPSTQPAASV